MNIDINFPFQTDVDTHDCTIYTPETMKCLSLLKAHS